MKRLTDYGPGFDADGVGGITLAERAGTIYVLDSANRDASATVVDHIVIPNASNGTVRGDRAGCGVEPQLGSRLELLRRNQ